jgi:hypothetical protein
MEFSVTQDFPGDLDGLWTAFGRPEYAQRKYRALGAKAVRVHRFDVTPQTIEVELERDIPVEPSRLPAWTRVLIGREQTLRHRTRWRRIGPLRVGAELEISPVGLPVRAHGAGTIVQTAAATRMVLSWRVTSTLPVLGRAAERLFARELRAALDADHAFTLRYLQRRAGSGQSTIAETQPK